MQGALLLRVVQRQPQTRDLRALLGQLSLELGVEACLSGQFGFQALVGVVARNYARVQITLQLADFGVF